VRDLQLALQVGERGWRGCSGIPDLAHATQQATPAAHARSIPVARMAGPEARACIVARRSGMAMSKLVGVAGV
jgi:hypothetical protein